MRKSKAIKSAVISASVIVSTSATAAYAAGNEIGVDYEYGTLKEVVVGVPFLVYPDLTVAKWAEETCKILPKEAADKVRARSGKSSVEIGKFDAMEKENNELIEIFKKHGVQVWRPETLSKERVATNFGPEYVRFAGISQQYTRDPFIVVGNNVIETAMGSLYRRSDILGLKKLFLSRLLGSNAKWVSMPIPDYSTMIKNGQFDKTGFPVLEGGDVIVLGKTVLVGNSMNKSTGSSELGYLWLKSYLEPQGYEVQRVRLAEDILHLDVALSVPKPGVIIVCPEIFQDGVPDCFKGWKQITVTRDETRHLAANGLPLDQSNYILGFNDHCDGKKIRTALEACGITVYPIFFGLHNEDGGSIRCSANSLVRQLGKDR